MTWQDTMTTILRELINDTGIEQTYTDSRLEQTIVVAAHFVVQDVSFSTIYTIDIINKDFSPDPVDSGDYDFINLVLLRASALVFSSEYKTYAKDAVIYKDDMSSIDHKAVADHFKELAKSAMTLYEDNKLQIQLGNGIGRAITSPITYEGIMPILGNLGY